MTIRHGIFTPPSNNILVLMEEEDDADEGEAVYSPVEEVLGLDVLPVLLQVHP